jgi:hypothetical protein
MAVGADDDGELWVLLVMFDQLRRGLGVSVLSMGPFDEEDVTAMFQDLVLRASTISNHVLTRFFSDWDVHRAGNRRQIEAFESAPKQILNCRALV